MGLVFRNNFEMKNQFYYSFVIDDVLDHLYKAELLLLSLNECASVPKDDIFIHLTNLVHPNIKTHFEALGYKVQVIAPYLDGKYCNKLRQLDLFEDLKSHHYDGVILLDIDMVVCRRIKIDDCHKIWAKIVDAPNPPLPVLLNIFHTASIPLPDNLECDCKTGETLSCNMNGGFYYIPKNFIPKCNRAWKKWAEFLFENPQLFPNRKLMIHVDQVAFGMVLCSENLPYQHLKANLNFPVHSLQTPRMFDAKKPISVIHYHSSLNQLGLISTNNTNKELLNALKRINSIIRANYSGIYLTSYKQNYAKRLISNQIVADIPSVWDKLNAFRDADGVKRKLIIHAGTPKTGTSTLQLLLGSNRSYLKEQGFWYPEPYSISVPKHQQLVVLLKKGDALEFSNYIYSALEKMPSNIHTIIFTTEGIYNHWSDFPSKSKIFLRHLKNYFEVEICTWFREPVSFATSLYAQYLKNPQQNGPSEIVYGQNLSFREAMDDEWFISHFDYFGYYYQLNELLGGENISLFLYSGNTVDRFLEHFNINLSVKNLPRQNQILSGMGVQIIRFINRFKLSESTKKKMVDWVAKIDALTSWSTGKFELRAKERILVEAYTKKQWVEFYGLLIK